MRSAIFYGAMSLALLAAPANAAVTVITFLDGTGASKNGPFALDGSSNNYPLGVICGATTATLGATVAECATVNASGQLGIAGPVTAIAGAFVTGSIADLQSASPPTPYAGSGAATAITELDAIRQNVAGAIPAGTNTIGGVTPVAAAAGGATHTGNIAANNTTAVVVKGSAGTLYGVQLYGIGSAPAYLKIYDATSATCGSGTPVWRGIIPAASTAANGAGNNSTIPAVGIAFTTGITYCVTTGITDADTTAPAASTFLVNLEWK